MISTLLTVEVLANSKQLADIKKYEMMLIKKRPGLCWEPVNDPELERKNETKEEGCR